MIRVKDQAEFKRQTRSNLETEKAKAAETEVEDLEHIETFAKTFAVGEVVAVAVQADEQLDFSNTDFYLAVVEAKPVKLKKAKRFQGNLLEAGRWVFTGRWLEFVRESVSKIMANVWKKFATYKGKPLEQLESDNVHWKKGYLQFAGMGFSFLFARTKKDRKV